MKKSAKLLTGGIVAGAAISATVVGATDYIHTVLIDSTKEAKKSTEMSDSNPFMPIERDRLITAVLDGQKWLDKQKVEHYTMVNDRGEKLRGYYIAPKSNSDVIVFCSHGYKGSGHNNVCLFGKSFVDDFGFGLFFVDHTASGESEGRYIGFSFFESVDCVKWLNYINSTLLPNRQIILHGDSMGSATVLCMTGNQRLPENVKFAIADCGYTSAWDQFAYELKTNHIPVHPILDIFNWINKKKVGFDFKDARPVDAVKKSKTPTLIIHGTKDAFVPSFMAQEIYDACSAKKELVYIENATHILSATYNPTLYYAKVQEFVDKYIDHNDSKS
ncbi:MAG: alpha/beta hydrolase [Oscillospiraceae bacterium]